MTYGNGRTYKKVEVIGISGAGIEEAIQQAISKAQSSLDKLSWFEVQDIRGHCPEMVLTTDIIVGFPTESDREFEDTYEVVKQVEFDSAFIFKYSERQGTVAARKYPDDVPEAAKKERIIRLNELQNRISLQKNQAHIGEIHNVLIEQESTRKSPHDYQGRNDGNKIVIMPEGSYGKGDTVRVKISDATPHVLKGQVINF